MGTVTDKLNKVLSTKEAIKAAIIEKGQTVADTDTFASYPDKIRAIETGGETSETVSITVQWLGSFTASVVSSNKSNTDAAFVKTKCSSNSSVTIQDLSIGDIIVVETSVELEFDEADCTNIDMAYASSNSCYAIITGPDARLSLYNP